MKELLKFNASGQWDLAKSDNDKAKKACSCPELECGCDMKKNVNASYSASPNMMGKEEIAKFSPGGQWSICKAREDKIIDPKMRNRYRKERQEMEGKDPMASRTTAAPGVSDRGIEARRGDARIPSNKVIAHGYARAMNDPSKHMEQAKNIARRDVKTARSAPKPKLP